MRKTQSLLGFHGNTEQVMVDRALAEFRAGRPVLIRASDDTALAISAELIEPGFLEGLEDQAKGHARLILPAPRLRRLGATDRKFAGIVALPTLDMARIENLVLKSDGKLDAPVGQASAIDDSALELAALSLVLPAVIVVSVNPLDMSSEPLVKVDATAINSYRRMQLQGLHMVSRAPVPLEGAPETEFVIFRGGEGLRDQVAIMVGKPDLSKPVHVRLHSACLTGDLFGSLKCDCGDQLRDTVRWMAENQGGILLYLDQEGRGNGLSNKMRAYKLQSEGWDTYDADEVLGFGLDQRHFDFAAEMLKQLGVRRVTALTNNPLKIGAIRKAGLEVAATQRVLGRPNVHNVRYLASKRDRAGHYIDMDAVMARAPVRD